VLAFGAWLLDKRLSDERRHESGQHFSDRSVSFGMLNAE